MNAIKRLLQLLSKNSKTGAVKVNRRQDTVRPEDVERLSAVATLVSPPHPVSNLRRVLIPARPGESAAELRFREQYSALQAWNHDYWVKHNAEFQQKKEEFTRQKLDEYKEKGISRDTVPAEDMATFYKAFLNDNHRKHMDYNWAWYRRNIGLLWPAALASWAYFYREVAARSVRKAK
ncbi:cytochrome c oxidase assembly factor 8 [Haemaphysalis longicornis]